MHRRKEKNHRVIAEKAREMGVPGFDAKVLAGWMKSMRTMLGKEQKKAKGKSARPSSPLGSNGSSTPSNSCALTCLLVSRERS